MFKTKKARPEARLPEAVAPQPQTFRTSAEVSKLSGVSLRQLQWWDEQKVVSPRHEGHRRVYSTAEVVEITVIAELRHKGFSLQKIRRVLKWMQREMGKHLGEVFAAGSEMHLLTDGKSIFLEDSQQRVIDILKNARQPMFLVCVSDQVKRLQAGTAPRKPTRAEVGPTVVRRKAAV
jgi:DNA-binding transcriptional MerR regulator